MIKNEVQRIPRSQESEGGNFKVNIDIGVGLFPATFAIDLLLFHQRVALVFVLGRAHKADSAMFESCDMSCADVLVLYQVVLVEYFRWGFGRSHYKLY